MVDQVLGIALRKSVRRTKNHDGYFEDAYSNILKKSKEIIVLDVGGTNSSCVHYFGQVFPLDFHHPVNFF